MFEPLIVLLVFGAALYVIGTWIYKRQQSRCPKYEYVYKPAVRTFTEEQSAPPSVFKMYQDMFYKGPIPTSRDNSDQTFSSTRGGTINPFVLGGLPTTDLGTVRESDNYLNG